MAMLTYNYFVREAQRADELQHKQSRRNWNPPNPNDPCLRDMLGNMIFVGGELVTLGRVKQLEEESLDYDAEHPSV